MKSNRIVLFSAVIWALSGLVETHAEDRPLRLAFITCSTEAKFFEPVKKGVEDAAAAMDVSCDFFGTVGVDLDAQAEMVRKAARDGYDGIALNLVDAEAFDEVVRETIAAGTPVVAFNTDDTTANARLSSVSQRLYQAGRRLAEHVAPEIAPGSHVLMTMHDEGISSLEDRLRGIQDVLGEKDVRWTVVITGCDGDAALKVVSDALRQHPNIQIVLSTGQADTEAAGRAVAALGGKDRWVAGFDLSPTTLKLIQQGPIRCTIDQQPYIQGFYPVVQLTQYLRYGITPSDIDAGAAIIDASNVDRVVKLTEQGYR